MLNFLLSQEVQLIKDFLTYDRAVASPTVSLTSFLPTWAYI
jgi:hypothetical protein